MHAYMQQSETGTWNLYQQAILPWKTIVKANGWTRKKLQRYGRFGVLYGERKYATKYPSSPFRLLGLPAEIRNKVYRYHLIIGSIELAPRVAPGGQLSDFRKHCRRCRQEVRLRVRLLRVNKQGENEFRFSRMEGYEMLFAFCRTIGKSNTAKLCKITVHAPWCGEYPGYSERLPHTNVTSWGNFQGLPQSMGLHEKGHGAWKFNIMRTLTRRDGGVKDYQLVLPDQFILLQKRNFVDYNIGRSLLPWFKKGREVNMTLVKAQTEQGFDNTGDRQEQLALRQAVEQEVRASGWKVVETTYDTLGNYEVKDHSDAEEVEDAGDVAVVAHS
ncbi:hypothetical protein LTR37_010755 [Vermiconidia calcicola]|uniref:Uncharacterized protein n=1 Tax=Vermiconidia calcicola TaxID=1690605 RepID=A0ACC3N4C2_9PEZI|nr:hypothetical protein LTR37_010755 [Vermiconidia calcicola]